MLPGDDHASLGAFNLQPVVEEFYGTCDAMLVVGSRLRSNETLTYTLKLPKPLFQIDADPRAEGRAYPTDTFVCGDSAVTLDMLEQRLKGRFKPDGSFGKDLQAARKKAEEGLRKTLGPYNDILDTVIETVPRDFVWVRDITLSNTIWGNRLPPLHGSRDGVHALGGGIGQGLPMGIGAALAVSKDDRKTLVLAGDGGFAVTLGELATAKQENADIAILLMNDGGYGVIKNIADAKYNGNRAYTDILGPDWEKLCEALDIPFWRVTDKASLGEPLSKALETAGPALVEVDMKSIGPFAQAFAGPPGRAKTEEKDG